MKKVLNSFLIFILCFILILNCSKTNPNQPDDSSKKWLDVTAQVNGTLTTLENMRVLKIYGSFYEMGYAHGYLLAPEIFERQELELSQPGIVEFFENQVIPNLHLFHISDQYLDEMKGVYNGVLTRGGGSIYSEVLKREVTLNDAIALNCINALFSRLQCSSFSAWNGITQDSSVITGYNHDTEDDKRYTGRWLIIVRKPSTAYATFCVGRAGDMNVHTVINERGITLSCQAVDDANSPTSSEGFTPEGLIFRELIESVDYVDPIGDISSVLNEIFATEAEALLMSWPDNGNVFSGAAIELDGNLAINHGFTIRQPDEEEEFIIQTNHFCLRQQSTQQCDRYNHVKSFLDSIRTGMQAPLTVESAWNLLGEICVKGDSYLTQHAVIFEPSRKRMHIAFAEPGIHAHSCNRVTLDIEELLP